MVKKLNLLLILIVIALNLSCSRREEARGPEDVIYVLASEDSKAKLGKAIDTTFSYGFRTPEFQKYFTTNWQPLENFKEFVHYKNLIIIADLNSDNLGAQITRVALPPDQYELAESDSIFLFAKKDFWAEGQIFVLIAGKNFDLMERAIHEREDWLYTKFDDKFEERQKEYLFKRYKQKDLAEYLWEHYRWTMRIQHDYMILEEYPDKKFVWLGRGFPYRWISVSWAGGVQLDWLTPHGLFKKQNEIWDLYSKIKTDTKFLGTQYCKFKEWDALKMWGLWYHEEEAMGGPFLTYTFYDNKTDRTFAINMLMFAPGEKINVLFRQIEIMAKTFTTTYTKE